MSKFLIIAFHPRTMTPYARQYEEEILKQGFQYDIVFWDRFSKGPLKKNGNEYIFQCPCTLGGNKLKKFYPFYLFRKTILQILSSVPYDKLIILNTMPGFLLQDVLLQHYKGRYVLDIRDYTYEKYALYKSRVLSLVDNSCFTALSSRGFCQFLGTHSKFVITHNISNELAKENEPTLSKHKSSICLGFVGVARAYEANTLLISKLAGKERYFLKYAGYHYPDCDLQEFCRQHQYAAVRFFPPYKNEEKPLLYKDIDIINTIFGDNTLEVSTNLPNRLYDGLLFQKPLLASKNTYTGNLVEKYKIGLAVDVKRDDVYGELNRYVNNFDEEAFLTATETLLKKICEEQDRFHKNIERFIVI